MGDVSTEPSMEEILSSIKRVIEESEAAPTARKARPARTTALPEGDERPEVLELSDRAPFPEAPFAEPSPVPASARPSRSCRPARSKRLADRSKPCRGWW